MVKKTLRIKARFSKKSLRVVIEDDDPEVEVEAETEAETEVETEVEVEVEVETEEISNDNTWEIVVEPFKTSIKILQPTPIKARSIADKLNQLPEVKGSTQWSPNQNGTIISVMGKIKKSNIEKIVQPLILEIMVKHRGDEK